MFYNTANGVGKVFQARRDLLSGEAGLSAVTLQRRVASGVGMGFPEVLFDLFPGMGAYSFLCRRVSPARAEKLMLDGSIYTSEQMLQMGIVDLVVPRGQGVQAVQDLRARVLYSVHNSTFDLAFHPWREPLDRVADIAEQEGLLLVTPEMGEVLTLGRPRQNQRWWKDLR